MWLDIVGYENLYEIESESKQIRRVNSGRIIPVKSGKVILSRKGCPAAVSVDLLFKESVTEEAKIKKESSVGVEVKYEMFVPKWENKSTDCLLRGDLGEHLVCVELLSRGVRCGLNVMQGAPYDVIGDFGNGKIFKIQVKARAGEAGRDRYNFKCDISTLKTCDVIAYVALDCRKVVFALSDDSNSASLSANKSTFSLLARESIDKVLNDLYERLK